MNTETIAAQEVMTSSLLIAAARLAWPIRSA